MSQATCKNCGASIIDAYCHRCGQKAGTSRITLKSLGHEIVHSFTHIEKGFLYTSIELFLHPGRVINGYLSGKRVNYHKPFGLYFLWTAIFLVVDRILKEKAHYVTAIDLSPDAMFYEASVKVFPYYEHYISLIILPLIVISPLVTYHLIIKKRGYNYAEAIIIAIYMQVTGFIIAILVELFGVITGTFNFIQSNQLVLIIPAIFQTWAFFDIIKKGPYWKSIVISLLLILMGYITFFCYLRFAVPFVVSLFM
ncbi:MAG TPA: DUF3667 domain-containing protein [Chitinophagaceae bacterium]|nr:DUF3667 domain-containing protein [Chitinophagaceae bacterium]